MKPLAIILVKLTNSIIRICKALIITSGLQSVKTKLLALSNTPFEKVGDLFVYVDGGKKFQIDIANTQQVRAVSGRVLDWFVLTVPISYRTYR